MKPTYCPGEFSHLTVKLRFTPGLVRVPLSAYQYKTVAGRSVCIGAAVVATLVEAAWADNVPILLTANASRKAKATITIKRATLDRECNDIHQPFCLFETESWTQHISMLHRNSSRALSQGNTSCVTELRNHVPFQEDSTSREKVTKVAGLFARLAHICS